MPNLNVLVLHQMGDPRHIREAVRSLEYMIPESGQRIDCVVHDAALPFPGYLRDVDFDLIVLGPTFLCNRYDPDRMSEVYRDYSFVGRSSACKIALPQDDYDCSAILDSWVVAWGIDRVYSVCPDKWDVLYPKYNKIGDIKPGYTTYISDDWIKQWESPKPPSQRSVDVSYRASMLPANFGSVGLLKSAIAGRFVSALPEGMLKLDISVDRKDFIPGRLWQEFVEDSRFCLVTPSGSSLLDPVGDLRTRVSAYSASNPDADFDEISRACFPGEDKRYLFTAISPRNIEAALAETVQIGTPGGYSHIMRPNEHFVLLNEDCSNIDEVVRLMSDHGFIDEVRLNCKAAILSEPRLRRANMVEEVLDFARDVVRDRKVTISDDGKNRSALGRYRRESVNISKRFWARRRIVDGLKTACKRADVFGIRELLRGVR